MKLTNFAKFAWGVLGYNLLVILWALMFAPLAPALAAAAIRPCAMGRLSRERPRWRR